MNDMPVTALKAMRLSFEPFEGVLPGAETSVLSSDAADCVSFMRRASDSCLAKVEAALGICQMPNGGNAQRRHTAFSAAVCGAFRRTDRDRWVPADALSEATLAPAS